MTNIKKMTAKQLNRWRLSILKNLNEEDARKFWDYCGLGKPPTETTVMAGIHKARLKHPEFTEAERETSRKWLSDHGYIPAYISPFSGGETSQ